MKTGFATPLAIKKQRPKNHPNDAKSTWWDCQQPQYDQRSSCFVNTGTHYGVGHRQPVGHAGDPKSIVSVLPEHRKNGMEVDEVG